MQLIRAAHKPGADSRTPTETFTGTVHMDPIFQASDCMANNVCFTPGARTFWHKHERGQILTVILGTGLICSEGGRATETPGGGHGSRPGWRSTLAWCHKYYNHGSYRYISREYDC